MLGVAIQVEGRFLRIVSRERKGVPLIDGRAGLRARISFEKKEDGTFTMQVDFLDGDPAS
jgi:hypothetical protein